ncbi:hypothetical protein YC2023_019537 [Brassica napus]
MLRSLMEHRISSTIQSCFVIAEHAHHLIMGYSKTRQEFLRTFKLLYSEIHRSVFCLDRTQRHNVLFFCLPRNR